MYLCMCETVCECHGGNFLPLYVQFVFVCLLSDSAVMSRYSFNSSPLFQKGVTPFLGILEDVNSNVLSILVHFSFFFGGWGDSAFGATAPTVGVQPTIPVLIYWQ